MSASPPTAGWYLDPEDPIPLRFFDGSTWTQQRRRTLAADLSADRLPIAPASDVDPREIARSFTHAKLLLALSLFGAVVGVAFAFLPVLTAVSFAFAMQADRARQHGHLVTARRRHLQARRWRLACYASIPIVSLVTLAMVFQALAGLSP